jgi:hypothetical protein
LGFSPLGPVAIRLKTRFLHCDFGADYFPFNFVHFPSILIMALTPRASQSVATRLIALQKLGPPTICFPPLYRVFAVGATKRST